MHPLKSLLYLYVNGPGITWSFYSPKCNRSVIRFFKNLVYVILSNNNGSHEPLFIYCPSGTARAIRT